MFHGCCVQSAAGDEAQPVREGSATPIGVGTGSPGRSTRLGKTFGWVVRGGAAPRHHDSITTTQQRIAATGEGHGSAPPPALARPGSRWRVTTAPDAVGDVAGLKPNWHSPARREEDLLLPREHRLEVWLRSWLWAALAAFGELGGSR